MTFDNRDGQSLEPLTVCMFPLAPFLAFGDTCEMPLAIRPKKMSCQDGVFT